MAKKKSDLVKVVCSCDRLPLEDGRIIVRDEVAEITETEAKNYESAERITRL